jgi:spermidine/putrescine-binding protein
MARNLCFDTLIIENSSKNKKISHRFMIFTVFDKSHFSLDHVLLSRMNFDANYMHNNCALHCSPAVNISKGNFTRNQNPSSILIECLPQ